MLRKKASLRMKTVGIKHKMCGTTTYQCWGDMKTRCNCPTNIQYHRYGGRGITVCPEWMDFRNFLKDMGEKPKGKTIDRIDNSKGYSKDNCRWATPMEQSQNTRKTRLIAFRGETLCMETWARRLGIAPQSFAYRVGVKMPLERMFKEIF